MGSRIEMRIVLAMSPLFLMSRAFRFGATSRIHSFIKGNTWSHRSLCSHVREFQSEFLRECNARGFIHQCTNPTALDSHLSSGIVRAYLGFDATAPSLHIGSLVQIMMLRKLQQHGHKPIVLLGGGTTKIGDPSGKDESRSLLSAEAIESNVGNIAKVFSKFLRFGDGPTDATLVNNNDWLGNINYLEFLREFGRHFTINRMISFDSVQLRLQREQPLTFLEFNYMILQAYDFLELHRRHNVTLQLGGSDQWGNIVNGIELGRKVAQSQLFGLTTPLMTTSDGRKMGKTESGAVWLDRLLKLFTDVPLETISNLSLLQGEHLNPAKELLADEATALLHGRECLEQIHTTAASLFRHEGNSSDLSCLPQIHIDGAVDAGNGSSSSGHVIDILIRAGLCTSKGEARRLIQGGGVKINDKKVDDNRIVSTQEFDLNGRLKLSVGKKKHVVIVLNKRS